MSLKDQVLELKNKCYSCKECPLGRKEVDGRDPHVFASGYVKSKIFFIAEAPGAEEVKIKKPLVGRAGQFFEAKVLGSANLKRSDIYITNSVLCRPDGRNRTPLPAEVETCRFHLDAQVCLLEPKLLITMGNVALLSCCGETGIVKRRGKLRWSREWSNGKKVPVFPIFHPSYCIRGSGLKEMAEDAETIGEFYKLLKEGGDIVVEE
jgi:DNA polymerase